MNESMQFALLRLILIDAWSPGRIVELPLAGGTVLTGRNGRGKTSLLQLLPLFYGERPSAIASAEANRLGFVAYYLPRSTSYLVYEYVRQRDQRRCVIVHADRSGEQLRYRFLRGAYREDFFVSGDGELVAAPDLRRHVELRGGEISEQIDSGAEYRALIQGLPPGTRDRERRQTLARLTADYSLAPRHVRLPNLEKIVSGMFRRRTHFEELQGMVIDCIADRDAAPELGGERARVEAWPRDYRAYRDVMALAPRMDEASRLHDELLAVEAGLGELHARHLSLIDASLAQMQACRGEQAALAAERADAARAHDGGRRVLEDELHAAGRAREDARARIERLDAQQRGFAQAGIEDLRELVARAPALREQAQQLERRREALLGEQQAISGRYERLEIEQQKAALQAQERFAAERRQHEQAHAAAVQVADAQQQQADAARRSAQRDAQTALNTRLEAAADALGRCRQRCEQPPVDAPSEQALGERQQALDRHQQALLAAHAQERAAAEALRQAVLGYEAAERAQTQARRELALAGQAVEARAALCMPAPDTLLAFLRSEHPGWADDVARVLREDLLLRTDLAPQTDADGGSGLYGIGLALDRLEPLAAADLDGARQTLADAQAQAGQARKGLAEAERQLEAAGAAHRKAQSAAREQEAARRGCEARIEAARRELATAQAQRQQALAAAAARAEAQLQAAEAAHAALRSERERLGAAERHADREAAEAHAARLQALREPRDAALAAVEARAREDADERAQALSGLLAERDQVLAAGGVDTAALQALDAQRRELQQRLQLAREAQGRVREWQRWLDEDWPRRAQALAAETEAAARLVALRTQLDAEAGRWRERLAAFEAQAAALAAQLAELERTLDGARARCQTTVLGSFPPGEALPWQPVWTLDALGAPLQLALTRQRKLLKALDEHVQPVQKTFAAQTDAPPQQYFEQQRSELPATAAARDWVAPLAAWYTGEHLSFRRLLMQEAVAIRDIVVVFHGEMSAFHRRVQQFNRELQQSLDTGLAFDSITRIEVEVISTLRELAYWPAIEALVGAPQTRDADGAVELPPPEFATTIGQLLEHWEVRSGIRAELRELIRIQGEVEENGQRRTFRRAADLERVSSNGLSYLVLCSIFVAFINRIRRQAPVDVVWALDELKDLDAGNVARLLELLARNRITLVSAFPDPDVETLRLFRHRFGIEPDRRLAEVRILDAGPAGAGDAAGDEGLEASAETSGAASAAASVQECAAQSPEESGAGEPAGERADV